MTADEAQRKIWAQTHLDARLARSVWATHGPEILTACKHCYCRSKSVPQPVGPPKRQMFCCWCGEDRPTRARTFDGSGQLTDSEFTAQYGPIKAMASNGKVGSAILRNGKVVHYNWQTATYIVNR